jgi:hypothetical protein
MSKVRLENENQLHWTTTPVPWFLVGCHCPFYILKESLTNLINCFLSPNNFHRPYLVVR